MLKKLIRSNLDDLWLFIGVEGGLFLLLEVIICCVMVFARPTDGVCVAWIMLPIAAGFVALMAVAGHAAISFDLALRFGQTRRRAMGQFLGLSCFETAFGLALAAVLSALERFVGPALWARLSGLDGWIQGKTGALAAVPDTPGMGAESGRFFVNTAGDIVPLPDHTLLVKDFSLGWYWWLLIFAIALAGGIVIGALLQRFGQKGLWIVWGLCMAASFATYFHLDSLLPGWLNSYSDLFFPVVLGLLAAGLFLWALWSMFHAVVRA